MDATGISQIIDSLGGLLKEAAPVASLIVTAYVAWRQDRLVRQTNGLESKLVAAVKGEATAEGHAAGVAQERADQKAEPHSLTGPGTPAGTPEDPVSVDVVKETKR